MEDSARLTRIQECITLIIMEERRIVWDTNKNMENKLKHGIGFEVAQYVFSDPERIWRLDQSEGNKSGEDRWQTIGKVGSLFFVVYAECEMENVNITRLISAREAKKNERRSYNGYYGIDNQGWTKDT
ncbi:hypothetical protein FACS1894164_12110 [Spirochaetia bacterium]|nr:hypothetical protein FACS1894164_12110 [Spirochaetia bacterium]